MSDSLHSSGAPDFVEGPLRYRRAPGARLSGDGEDECFLKTSTGRLLVLGERERFLWEAIDDAGTFETLRQQFYLQFGSDLRADDLAQFVSELTEAGALELLPQIEVEPERIRSTARRRKVQLDETEVGDVPGAGDREPDRLSPGQEFQSRRKTGGNRLDRAARQRLAEARAARKELWSWPIGNPEKLLDALARVFTPIRWVFWLLIPLVIMAFLIGVKHSKDYFDEWTTVILSIPRLPASWAAEHVISWSARIVEGTVIRACGGRVTRANLKVFLGVFLRLKLDESSVKLMTRRRQLWVAASPLLWRLFVFSISMVIWITYRQSHPLVSQVALFMAFIGLLTFTISSCPFLPMYGYRFMSVWLGQEHLNRRAVRFLWLKIRGLPAPDAMGLAERWGLLFMATGTLVISTVFVSHTFFTKNAIIVTDLGGIGGLFTLGLCTACALYFVAMWRMAGKIRALHRAERRRDVAEDDPARP